MKQRNDVSRAAGDKLNLPTGLKTVTQFRTQFGRGRRTEVRARVRRMNLLSMIKIIKTKEAVHIQRESPNIQPPAAN